SSDPDNRVCQGGSITLVASSTEIDAVFYWEDENEQIFSQQAEVALSNLQQSRTIKVLAEVNGCFTAAQTVNIIVNDYINAEFNVDDRTPLPGEQEIIFTPDFLDNSVQYLWNFGDGTSSTDPVARHTYATSGKFNVVLTTQNGSGCSNTFFRNQFIITDGGSTICDSPLDSDGDGIKDDCDNCPFYPNFTQADDDGNGKGNECDCNFYATDQNFLTIGGTLESKRYIAAQNITSDGKVVNGFTELLAGNQITLEAGFAVEAGATFVAQISETPLGNCQPFADDDVDLRQAETNASLPTAAANELLVYPNPFNENTQVVYQLERSAFTEVAVFDLHGKLVKILQTKRLQPAGRIELELQATDLVAGIYYVRLLTDGKVGQMKKVVKL
ncbi:MAG: PKD domain-containing protein, partial [Saprospiraceae bacterium]